MQKKKNPAFNETDAQRIASKIYGIAGSIKSLDSYIDRNFLVEDSSGKRYVLKIANHLEPREILEAQNQAMEYIAGNNTAISCPRPCPSKQDEAISIVEDSNGTPHFVRLVSFLPGTFWAQQDSFSPHLQEHLGRCLGSLDKTLAGFHHPSLDRHLEWDLKNVMDLEAYLDDLEDSGTRRLVNYFLQQFKTMVVPRFSKLRTGVIHNDANDYNILTEGDRVTGLIDFGDMVKTFTVCELAIATAYVIPGREDPIAAAARVVKGYHETYPLEEIELDVLFHLLCARLCSTLLMSAHQLKLEPENHYLRISVNPALDILKKLITVNPPQACDAFRRACGYPAKSHGLSPDEILAIREQHLGASLSVSYKTPLKIVRGAMQYLYDHTGRAYLDTVNNVCHVGHCHPRVVKAAQEQMAVLNTNTRYLHDNIVEYALQLTSTLPDPLSVCFFVNSGSEANELALRMARTYTGHTDFVVLEHGYHGNTNAVIDVSAYKFDGPGGSGCPPHVHKAMIPDVYRGVYKAGDPGAGEKYARDVQRAIQEVRAQDRTAAAFLHESLLSVAGQVMLPEGYLFDAYQYAREAGALCIADEVQVGFGRAGTHMWAFETQEVFPDIVTMGKPIGNGHPLAAVVTTPEIAEAFANGMEYFNTFGGNPVSCAVGRAVLDVIRDEQLQENALETGEHMKAGLHQLMEQYPLIGDVRGMGLFIGFELVKDRNTLEPAREQAYYIAERMKEEGILVSVDGPLYNVIKIKPPLVFTEANADRYVETLEHILKEEPLKK